MVGSTVTVPVTLQCLIWLIRADWFERLCRKSSWPKVIHCSVHFWSSFFVLHEGFLICLKMVSTYKQCRYLCTSQGYYRRAASLMALGKLKQAVKDFETVYLLCAVFRVFSGFFWPLFSTLTWMFLQVTKRVPSDKDAKLKFNACQKLYKQKQFEWAIRSDETKTSVFDSVDPANIGTLIFSRVKVWLLPLSWLDCCMFSGGG